MHLDKPPIEDLQYFLDYQIARVWAPEQKNLQRKEPVCPSLQFSLMGPKLYISPEQVIFLFYLVCLENVCPDSVSLLIIQRGYCFFR